MFSSAFVAARELRVLPRLRLHRLRAVPRHGHRHVRGGGRRGGRATTTAERARRASSLGVVGDGGALRLRGVRAARRRRVRQLPRQARAGCGCVWVCVRSRAVGDTIDLDLLVFKNQCSRRQL